MEPADEFIAAHRRLRAEIADLKAHLALRNADRALYRLGRELKAGFDPNQPRVPAGSPGGGQWTDGGGGGRNRADAARRRAVPAGTAIAVPAVVTAQGAARAVAGRVAAAVAAAGSVPTGLAAGILPFLNSQAGQRINQRIADEDGSSLHIVGFGSERFATITATDARGGQVVFQVMRSERGLIARDGHAIVDGEPVRLAAGDLVRTWNRMAAIHSRALVVMAAGDVGGGKDRKPRIVGHHADGTPIYSNDNGSPPLEQPPDDEDPDPSNRPRHNPKTSGTQLLGEAAIEHILNGEINKRGKAVGGHSLDSGNLRVVEVTASVDRNGVLVGRIEIYDNATGQWVAKTPQSSFFPAGWSPERVATQIDAAFRLRRPVGGSANKWRGRSPSGIMVEGYVDRAGIITTAYPVHGE